MDVSMVPHLACKHDDAVSPRSFVPPQWRGSVRTCLSRLRSMRTEELLQRTSPRVNRGCAIEQLTTLIFRNEHVRLIFPTPDSLFAAGQHCRFGTPHLRSNDNLCTLLTRHATRYDCYIWQIVFGRACCLRPGFCDLNLLSRYPSSP